MASPSTAAAAPVLGRKELVDDLGVLGAATDRLAAERTANLRWVFTAGASRGRLVA